MSANNRPQPSPEFFVAGGTLDVDAPSYVSRPADEQLFSLAQAGEFCYVLTTRQMGKSSLMVRTARRLKDQGVRIADIDLTVMPGKTEETWYLDFLTELADKLNLSEDPEVWWQAHAAWGAGYRFGRFLRDVLLEEIGDPIVIFVDEIDYTLGLPFADDFFAAVRAVFNARAMDAKFNRLTFVFLGVAAPTDLIKDRTRTPFNIGQGIVLTDLGRVDAVVLLNGLEAVYPGQGRVILDRIFYWTSGHPYLTQKLCLEAVDRKRNEPWTVEAVDRIVGELFLSDQPHQDKNLDFVQKSVLKNPHRRELLKLYGKVRAGKPVANDEQSVLQNQLKLAGLVTTDGGHLQVHNEIYRVVFDAKWIKANTPRDNNRIVTYAAVVLAVIVVGLAGFVLWYDSYVQQRAKDLRNEFSVQAGTAQERLDRLAQLFELHGALTNVDFDDAARRLFFEMGNRQDQLALFQEKNNDRVVTVIKGVYTALADVNNRAENDALLEAMGNALIDMGDKAPGALRNEIQFWLSARRSARQGPIQYGDALADYDKAIVWNDDNPATHYEKARILLQLQPPIYSQASGDLDAAIEAARKLSVQPSELEPAVTATPTESAATPTPLPTGTRLPKTPTPPTNAKTATPGATRSANVTSAPNTTPASGQPALPPAALPSTATPPPGVTSTLPLPPFRSEFIDSDQIARAVKNLIDNSPGLVAFLANSVESDYGNLRQAKLVRTLTPTPTPTVTPTPAVISTVTLTGVSATQVATSVPLTDHVGAVNSVAFSPDGRMLATGNDDKTIVLWDVANPKAAVRVGAPLTGHTDVVASVAFSPDGRILASGSKDKTVILWDVSNLMAPAPVGAPLTGHTDVVASVAFSPDGKTLASGGDKTIILWDVASGRPSTVLTGRTNFVVSVAFSPDGKTLASGSSDKIVLWNVASGQPIGQPLIGDLTNSIAFSPDGKTLASGSADGSVSLWDVASGQQLWGPSTHSSTVFSVGFSPDGKALASGSTDGRIILWNTESGRVLGEPLTGHTGQVTSVAFSPDGKMLASGGVDGTVRIWDAATGSSLSVLGGTASTPSTVVPWGKSLAGVGMGSAQPLTSVELKAIADSKVEAVLVLTLGNADENTQLVSALRKIRPDMFIVARLYFAPDAGNKAIFTPQDFANFVDSGMQALYGSGVRYFEVGLEPNRESEGLGWNWADGAEYGSWFTEVYKLLKDRYPDAQLGYPGLSPQSNVAAFLDGSAATIQQADWIGVHAYWQSANQPPYPMTGDNAGMFWRQFRDRFPNKLIMITEFSNNSATVADVDKGNQYAQYYQLLRKEPNLGAAFSFAISWPGQDNNHEGWVFNGAETAIPTTIGKMIGQSGFLEQGPQQ